MVSGYVKVYIPKHVPALIFKDYLKVGSHSFRICSASFLMQIIYNNLYQALYFSINLMSAMLLLCCAWRQPLGIKLWIWVSLLANGVQKGWKMGAKVWGFLLIHLVYSLFVCFLFKPDTANRRWHREAGREKADFVSTEYQSLQSKNGKFQGTEFQPSVRSWF